MTKKSTPLIRGSVSDRERSLAPDLARGFMLLLIVLAHAPLLLFGTTPGVLGDFGRPEGVSSVDKVVDFVALLFVDSRAYPMFAALFGYGLAMMVGRQLASGTSELEVRRLLRRRSLFLLLFGLVHFVIIGGADILAFYGVAGLLVGWLLFRENRMLIRALLFVGLLYLILIPLAWVGIASTLVGESMDRGISATTTYAEVALEHLIAFPFVPLFQLLLWPILLPILVGIWAARKHLLDKPQAQYKLLRRIAIIGIPISVVGGLPRAMIEAQLWEPTSAIIGLAAAVHILTGLAGGLGYGAMFGLIGARVSRIKASGHTGMVAWCLAAMGKRSLTFYIYGEAMLVIILSPVAFGLGGMLHSTGAAIVAVLVWLSGVGLASLLEFKGLRGPADALLRRLVYRNRGRRQENGSMNLTK
ncbi:DUF418 domain-containing protein [Desmospora activa]|uniref:Putative membrane protein YeiB n=1 Tax=Desmospora activa DSM 45169 TaxID=1121389 RepID=A0A2T4Z0R9_9BACL|nr:DUF418 domain-containing protein [Desmospora activa]PTM53336.1 putative membrane protein YeiB [Desmospora activa DSM 45169]